MKLELLLVDICDVNKKVSIDIIVDYLARDELRNRFYPRKSKTSIEHDPSPIYFVAQS